MTRDDGFVYDDGVVGRPGRRSLPRDDDDGRRAARVEHMEDYLQTEFPHLKVWLTSVTEQWAVIAVQRRAREIITPLVDGVDISNEAFPHMSVAECGHGRSGAPLPRVVHR